MGKRARRRTHQTFLISTNLGMSFCAPKISSILMRLCARHQHGWKDWKQGQMWNILGTNRFERSDHCTASNFIGLHLEKRLSLSSCCSSQSRPIPKEHHNGSDERETNKKSSQPNTRGATTWKDTLKNVSKVLPVCRE